MPFYHFKKIPVTINNNRLFISEAQLETSMEIDSPFYIGNSISEEFAPKSAPIGYLKFKYYLTGQDFLKDYIYGNEDNRLTGNVGGMYFTQGYLNYYNINCTPNSPIEVNASIQFFDQISGTFSSSSPIDQTGFILKFSDAVLSYPPGYISETPDDIIQANFIFNCQLTPSYSIVDTGEIPTCADRVSVEQKTISSEILSNSLNLNMPISGDNFGISLFFVNPYNTGIQESFGCSGKVNYKSFNIQSNKTHSHTLRVSQSHLNNLGSITGVQTGTSTFSIYSNLPNVFSNSDNTINYVNRISVLDNICDNFTVNKLSTHDRIDVQTPYDIINGPLIVNTTKSNLFFPFVDFPYSGINITGLSQTSGVAGSNVQISGENFYRISKVSFGGVDSNFQVVSPILINAIVPSNGITDYIKVISDLRSKTGISNLIYFCEPSITTFSPVTGKWNDTITIGGSNFTGVTGVSFNNVFTDTFTLLSNSIISATTPDINSGYSEGYVQVLTSGGTATSETKYTPTVPLYSFDPVSGQFLENITLSLNVDSDYMCNISGGFKIRFGRIDTIFYQDGTGLTGAIPVGGIDDHVYIYKPDGISTYKPNNSVFNVISEPDIYSITPAYINRFVHFLPTIIGANFRFFTDQEYYLGFSGGISGDFHKFTNITSNSGSKADTMYCTSAIITGAVGYYDVLIQNAAGIAVFKSGIYVTNTTNKAYDCVPSIAPSNARFYTQGLPYGIYGKTPGIIYYNLDAGYSNDKSSTTFAAMICTATKSGAALTLTTKKNAFISASTLRIVMDNLPDSIINGDGTSYDRTPSGYVALYQNNLVNPVYNSDLINLENGYVNLIGQNYNFINQIKIFTPGKANSYLGISEIEIF